MDYAAASAYLDGFNFNGIKPGLERIRKLLELAGNPQKELRFVHVAGTNGKGSVCAFLSSVLLEAGYNAGVFTSPHLNKINESIRDKRGDISDRGFASVVERLKEIIEGNANLRTWLTKFEILTAAAFLFFKDAGCNPVILEAGLGGLEDSTNIIDSPIAAVITKISIDHSDYLGDTVEKIAAVKAGIIKKGSRVVLAPQEYPSVDGIVSAFCRKAGARLTRVCDTVKGGRNFESGENSGAEFQTFDYGGFKNLKIKLNGGFQTENAAAAVEAAEALREAGYKISSENIYGGLANAEWPCRIERLTHNGGGFPAVYIDAAHNPDGVNALKEFLDGRHPGKKIKFIFGVLKDKDYRKMAETVSLIAERVYAVKPNSPRALEPRLLKEVFDSFNVRAEAYASLEDAAAACMRDTEQDGIICAFGSLYYAGAVKKEFERIIK